MKQYGKLTSEELKQLIHLLPMLEQAKSELDQSLKSEDFKFKDQLTRLTWSAFYENDYIQNLALTAESFGFSDSIKTFAKQENPTSAAIAGGLEMQSSIDLSQLSEEQLAEAFPQLISLIYSNFFSIKALLVYGLNMHELIKIARESSNKESDKALFKAIRIDPTAINCPTARYRLSQAVAVNDEGFLKKLKSALSGKLGKREAKNYQQIRFILQVLMDTNAIQLSDQDLRQLFVEQLSLYSDSQHSSEKNLKEFTYKFINQKPTT